MDVQIGSRWELWKDEIFQCVHFCPIYKKKKPNVRSDHSKVNTFDAYGLRPLTSPWKYLSAYEFWTQWHIIPLLVPSYYTNRHQVPRTKWTADGRKLISTTEYKNGKVAAKPGIDFIAVPSENDEYYLFPEHPFDVFKNFRHAWALMRNARPVVVVIEGLQLPNSFREPSYNGQYCSLFFRP